MNAYRIASSCIVATLLAISIAAGPNNAAALQQQPPNGQQGAEVLTRGPVHEAFAETVTFDPQPGSVAPKAPPAPIEELPPDERPEGGNVAWIPGYWAWDDERSDFLWVSGIWRSATTRPAVGARLLGAVRNQVPNGHRATGPTRMRARLSTCRSRPQAWKPVLTSRRLRRTTPGCRCLGLAAKPLCLAAWLLGSGAVRLELDARPLCLDPSRLCLRRWLLRLFSRPPRSAVRAGVFQLGQLSTARLLLLAGHGDQPRHLWQPPLLATGLRPLLLRRLLRFELRHRGLFPLVFVQFQPLRL